MSLPEYQSGDFFDASVHFNAWQAFVAIRWRGSDGMYYCDLYTNIDALTEKTGAAAFTPEEIEAGFELCGGPTCRAQLAKIRKESGI